MTDRVTLDALAAMREADSAMLAGAGAAIVVVGRPDLADTWTEDCSIVMANMHLAADALGLGSCWIQGRMRIAPDGSTTDAYVRDLLGVPEEYALEAALPLGIPAEHGTPTQITDQLREKIHRERF